MLEPKDIVGYGMALLIASGGWLLALRMFVLQTRANRQAKEREERAVQKQRMLDKVTAHIEAYANLADLYYFHARRNEYVVQNDDGSLKKDADGNWVIHREIAQPEEQFETTINALEGSDFKSAIAKDIFQIRRTSSQVRDILRRIDPNGELGIQMAKLHYETRRAERCIERRDVDDLVAVLNTAAQLRYELITAVEEKLQMTNI